MNNTIPNTYSEGATSLTFGTNNGNPISYSEAVEIIKNLSGKIFTLLDAVVVNDRQLKALKDSIRNDIAYAYSQLYEITDPNYRDKIPVAGVDFDEKDLKEVSLEEAIGV